MQAKPTLNKWKLFTQWVLANAVGTLVVMPITTILIISLSNVLLGLVFRVIRKLATVMQIMPTETDKSLLLMQGAQVLGILRTIISIAVVSLLLGLFQSLILRQHIANSRKWVLMTFIGLSIGLSVIIFGGFPLILNKSLSNTSLWLLSGGIGAIIGLTLGIAQWSYLREYVRYSSLWILGNVISCSLATNMSWGWPSFLGTDPGDQGIWFVYAFIVLLIRLIFVSSIISGIMLAWMLEHPLKELEMTNTA